MKQKTNQDRDAGIAALLNGAGPDHAGMAIVVDRRHLLTCAHVVNVAMGFSIDSNLEPHPSAKVQVFFPMLAGRLPVNAKVILWNAPSAEDVAVLQLDSEVPDEVGVAILAEIAGVDTANDPLSVFGIPAGAYQGNHIDAVYKSAVSAHWRQIDGAGGDANIFVKSGYSGAAVWDDRHRVVVGMVVARNRAEQERVAYMIPAARLQSVWSELEIEERALSATFYVSWTAVTTLFLSEMIAHFLVGRGVPIFASVTFSGGNKQLAELWGMEVYAIFALTTATLLALHARDFRLHQWAIRVPEFLRLRSGVSSGPRRAGALASIFAFFVVPLYLQGHFIHQFHDREAAVAIYPRDFDYTVDELLSAGQRCSPSNEGTQVCTHGQAGIYGLVEGKNGNGAFWNNAYVYGDDRLETTQTFFPVLQPLLIYALSLVAVAIAGRTFWCMRS